MNLKSLFISLWMTLLVVALLQAAWLLLGQPGDWSWWAVVLAVSPSLVFFARLFLRPVARTAAVIHWPWLLAALALIPWGLGGGGLLSGLYIILLGVVGNLLYQFWFSILDRSPSKALQVGKALPQMTFENLAGEQVSTATLPGPLLLIFYRGNWCPLCMAQIREVAAQYQALEQRGVSTLLISPQPHHNSQQLAQRFAVNFQFLIDKDLQMARRFQLLAKGGLPMGMQALGYQSDTVFPTVVLTDASQTIVFADQTDNYRVRPEPSTFLALLDRQ